MQLTAHPGSGSEVGVPGRSAQRDAEFTAYLAEAYLVGAQEHLRRGPGTR